jgi:predicted solute-binding protein
MVTMTPVPSKPRIGTVPYLNARPLTYGLYGGDEVTLLHDLPSQLARDLAGGNLDAALVPALVCAERPEYRVVPGIAIGSDGAVESVQQQRLAER